MLSHSKELSWVAAGYLLNLAGLAAAIKLLTTLLGPLAFGEYALGLAIAGILQGIIYGPISQATMRFFADHKDNGQLTHFFDFLTRLQTKVAVHILVWGGLISFGAAQLFGNNWGMVTITAVLIAVAGGANTTIAAIFSANRDRAAVALYQGVGVVLSTLFSIVAIKLWGGAGYVALVGSALGALIMATVYFHYLKRAFVLPALSLRLTNKSDDMKEFVAFASPFVLFAVFGSIVNYGDRWMVQAIFRQEYVGIYTVLFLIANTPMNLFGTVVTQFVLPILYSIDPAHDTSRRRARIYRYVLTFSALFLMLGVLVAFLFSEPILALLSSDEFVPYHKVLWVMALGCAIFQFAQLCVMRGFVEKRPQVYVIAKAAHATSFLMVLALVGDRLSLMGVGLAICISSFIYLIAILIANKNPLESDATLNV